MSYTRVGSLLSTDDFASFNAKDPNWFLDAADATITDYCGWHIAPERTDLNVHVRVGNKGIVMLPSLNVLSVEQITAMGSIMSGNLYEVHDSGWIEFPSGLLRRNSMIAVDFTHGYEKTPVAVAEVGYELAATALEKASGIAEDITRGPTRIKFKELGIVLSEDQQARLEPYNLRSV